MAVNILNATGGSGVKIAISFIENCLASSKDYGTTYIVIHDADRENGDCNQLRRLVNNYAVAHKLCVSQKAATEIILMDENLADCMKGKNLNSLISPKDPRRDIMNGSTDEVDRSMNLLDGQYGRADIGAFNCIARRPMFEKSKMMKTIIKFLEDGKDVCVMAAGGITGGTGPSYTLDNVMKVKDIAVHKNLAKNLHCAVALLGPCMSNPKPTEQQLAEFGSEYHVDSNEAYARAAATFEHMDTISNLLPNDPDKNGNYYLDRMYFVGNPVLDPGQTKWMTNHQEVHPTHLLHFMLGTAIVDFFSNYNVQLEESDNGLRTIRINNGNEATEIISWENFPSCMKSDIVSTMRFCYIFLTEIVPLFALDIDDMKDNRVTCRWFARTFSRKLCIDQKVLDNIIMHVDSMSDICIDYFTCFYDIQNCTELGTGRKIVKLFDQQLLKNVRTTDYKSLNSFMINEKSYCVPDRLTEESFPNLRTGLDGTAIMDNLAEDKDLCAFKESCKDTNPDSVATKIVQLIVKATYNIARIK